MDGFSQILKNMQAVVHLKTFDHIKCSDKDWPNIQFLNGTVNF